MPDLIMTKALQAFADTCRFARLYVGGEEVGGYSYKPQPVQFQVEGDEAELAEPVVWDLATEDWGKVDGVAFSEQASSEVVTPVYPVEPPEGKDGSVEAMEQFSLPRGSVVIRQKG